MEYLEFLEHMRTLLDAPMKRAFESSDGFIAVGRALQVFPVLKAIVDSEIQSEHQRGELALRLALPIPPEAKPGDPWRCAQCGDVIYFGERQHVCNWSRHS